MKKKLLLVLTTLAVVGCIIATAVTFGLGSAVAEGTPTAQIRGALKHETTDLRVSELLEVYTEGFSSNAKLQYEYRITTTSTKKGGLTIYDTADMYKVDPDGKARVYTSDSKATTSSYKYFALFDKWYGTSYGGYDLATVTVTVTDTVNKVSTTATYYSFKPSDLKADADNMIFILFKGQSEELKNLYGLNGITHISGCGNSKTSNGKIVDTKIATYNNGTIKAVATGVTTMTVKISKEGCAYHSYQEVDPANSTIYVVDTPVANDDGSITIKNVPIGVKITINGEEKTSATGAQDLKWTGLNSNTKYPIEASITNNTTKATAKADTEITTPTLYKVTVNATPEGYGTASANSATCKENGTVIITPTPTNDDYAVDSITYKKSGSSTSTTVTKNSDGKYAFKMPAKDVTVTVTFKQVKFHPNSISVTPESATKQIGETQQLTVTFNPTNTTDKSVTWSSDHPEIASVDENGLVTMNSAGTAIITCTSVDDPTKTDTAEITVIKKSNGFDTEPSIADWVYGDTPSTPSCVVKGGTPTYKYEGINGTTYGPSTEVPTLVGEYNLIVDVPESDEYQKIDTKKVPFKITKRPIIVADITANNKTYDGKTDATLNCDTATLNGLVEGDELSVTAKGVFENADAGNGKTVNLSELTLTGADSANYVLAAEGQQKTATADITKKTITVKDIAAKDKIYDGNTDATLDYTNVKLDGLVGGDDLSVTAKGTFENADVGEDKTVNISELTLTGNDKDNYQLAAEGQQKTATADITKKTITVKDITAKDKVYDGNTTATVDCTTATLVGKAEGDDLSVSAKGVFADPNVGEDKTVNLSDLTLTGNDKDNYQLAAEGQQKTATADITKKTHNDNHDNDQPSGPANPDDFKASVEPIDDKTYTGSEIKPDNEVIVKDENDEIIPNTQYDVTYEDNTNVGTAKVKITFKNNYDGVLNTTFEIVPKKHNDNHDNTKPSGPENPDDFKASIAPIDDKTYTGSEIKPDINVMDEKGAPIPSDQYDVSYENNTNAGTATVKVKFKNNYSGELSTTFKINQKLIVVKDITAKDKVYDGTTDVTVDCTTATLDGKVQGDDLSVSANGVFADPNVGEDKTVNLSGLTLTGSDKDNYKLDVAEKQQKTATADITPKTHNDNHDNTKPSGPANPDDFKASIDTIPGKVYTGSQIKPDNEVVVKDEKDNIIPNTQYDISYENNTDAGTATVKVKFKNNYSGELSTTFEITPKLIVVKDIAAKDKTYDGNTNATLDYTNVKLDGKVQGDDLSVTANGVFVDANVGEDKTVNLSGLTLTGSDKNNYKLDVAEKQQKTATADITKKSIVVKDIAANDKVYDGNTNATLDYTNVKLDGKVQGDDLSVTANGAFADPNVGEDKTVNLSGLTLTGSDKDNYELAALGQQKTTTADITKKKHNDNHNNGQPSGPSNPDDFKASVEPIDDKTFTGNEITPNDEVIVKDENGVVIPNTQYDISYEDNTNVGTAKVKITFKNNYDGVLNTTFEIVPKKHNDNHDNGQPSGPSNPGDFKASVEPITDKSYTGNEITPTDEIVIKDENGNVIPSSEYDITFSDNIDAGVANVKITFKNNYSGVLNATFNIVPKAHDDKHNNKKDKGDDNPGDFKAKIDDIPAILYNGSPLTPKPVIRDGDKILVEGKDYKIVGYEKNNEVGTATVYVEFMGNYSGTSSVTFDIFAKTSPKTSDTAPIALSITLIISMIFSALAAFVLVSKKRINEV